ncbi:PD-(D/E)XK nuclease family protein [Thermodesulfobium sp. 4217-1]|uniref:PD-(D/E)XK nuclease family protein n=1 Tax=Thermodesulfobium sp. 4217-1 TaxID=3120013 RepID=UPI003221776B
MNLSPSSLNLLLTCSYAYRLKYIDKVQPKFNINTVAGSAFHFTLSRFFKTNSFDLESSWKEYRYYNPETLTLSVLEEDKIKNNLFAMLRLYEPFARDLKVISSEEAFSMDIGNIRFQGIVDAITEDSIIDFKTTTRIPSNITSSHIIQTSIYSILTNIDRVELHYISDKRVVIYKTQISNEMKEKTLMVIESVKDILENKTFIPNGLIHPYACKCCSVSNFCCFSDGIS